MSSIQKIKEKVFRTIEKFGLIEENDRIFVAISGGKDSCSALFLLKEFIQEKNLDVQLKAFFINLGYPNFEKIQEIVEKQAELAKVNLIIFDASFLGKKIEEISRKSKRPICSICGLTKRYLLNKIPRELGATKLATGHHLDDFLTFSLKNLVSKNYSWTSKFLPKLKSNHPKLLTKIRPLFFITSSQTKQFCSSLNIPIAKNLCPYTPIKLKKIKKWNELTKFFEEKFGRNFKIQLLSSLIKISKKFEEKEEIKKCKICGEPTNQEICSFCKIFGKVEFDLNKQIVEMNFGD
ncbi:MAG: arginosuccinate synthase [Candidatus Aenigmarchaeota archaeon ex4484_224]|nr:MAG: arginosuccinate synthase [Candidatus Aenigmarchaeota archaeon ex4484_224]